MTLAIYIAGLFPSPKNFPTKALMQSLGIPLIVLFYSLAAFVTYSYFAIVLPWYIENKILSGTMTIIGVYILYAIVFSYTKCIMTQPGSPSGTNSPLCNKCKTSKPSRTHHCSVCGKCVLKMDHHCPWINNCLGMRNHSYFLLFLLYLDIGCFFFTIVGFPVVLSIPKNGFLITGLTLCGVFSVVLLGFGGWHWFLAFRGTTTIEYFCEDKTFSAGSWRKNLEVVFGTSSLTKILIPSSYKLLSDGTYWPNTLHSI